MKKGFTLLELLMVVSILVLLGTASLASFVNSRNIRDLTTFGQNVVSILKLAQSRALAGENNSQWGVRLESGRFILFQGVTYAGAANTQIYVLPSHIQIWNIALAGGGQDVIFKKLTGRTDQSGIFELQAATDASKIFSVTVDASGKVYQTGTAPAPTGARIADTRHRAFNLGWSIQNSLALTLTFSDPTNPDFIYPVAMTPLAPRSAFDWSGTVAVAGQNQTLRIHAISITGSNTILHIDRDCRYNNKRVAIAIDTRDIATYEADCQNVTVGVFGGTISEP